MGIVIFRSMGEETLEEERMRDINLADKEEIRRIVSRACNREAGGTAVMRGDIGTVKGKTSKS